MERGGRGEVGGGELVVAGGDVVEAEGAVAGDVGEEEVVVVVGLLHGELGVGVVGVGAVGEVGGEDGGGR